MLVCAELEGKMSDVISSESETAPSRLSFVRRHAPLFEAVGFLSMMVAYIVAAALKLNDSILIYARDDTYIHMSIAKHLVLHHVWGVTPYAFVSASSSPLWTSILAASYWLFGVGDKAPLVLSLLSAIALLILIDKLLRRARLTESEITVVLFAVVFAMPMPYLVLDAMEPALHTIFTIAFLYCASELLSAQRNRYRDAIVLAILAPLLVAARFEGLFLLTLTAALFVIRRRYLYAILLLGLGAIPVAIVGIPSMIHGGWILPNSVMLKGNWPSGTVLASVLHLAFGAMVNFVWSKVVCLIALLTIAALFLSADRKNQWNVPRVRLALFLGILFAHLTFAHVGRPFRYEAYLVVTGIFVLASCLKEPWCEHLIARLRNLSRRSAFASAAIASLMLLVSLPLAGRGLSGLLLADRASHNCFEQQYQMARFARRFYEGQALVLNDIGFVTYLADIKLIDVVGLGTTEVARGRARYDVNALERISYNQGAKIAMVYPSWLPGVPNQWTKVGEWEVDDIRIALGARIVVFFATNPAEAEPLRGHLEQFDRELPAEVSARVEPRGTPTASASTH